MRVLAVVPARMGATRFPGKPLADILGLPMVLHVWERARRSPAVGEVVIATCDEEIRKAAEAHGARVIMTSPAHQRATDRVAEAAEHVAADVVINVQGDEPLLDPRMLEQISAPLVRDPSLGTVNLIQRLTTDEERQDPNLVKVVFTPAMRALYLSREPIPTRRHVPDQPAYRQLGIIAFSRDFLRTFAALPPTPLERAESVDVMRILEHGYPITLVETTFPVYSVDTPPELERVRTVMATDPLGAEYLSGRRGAVPA